MWDSIWQESRLAVRAVGRNSGFCLVVILTLAVGIGATTAVFSIVNAVLLTPLPFPEAGRLAVIWETDRLTGTLREASAVQDYEDFRAMNRSFEELAAWGQGTANFSRSGSEPRRLTVIMAEHRLTGVLGVRLQLGREIAPEEDRQGGEPVVLLSDSFWRQALGADPAVLGRVIQLDDKPYTVIGVLPADLEFPSSEPGVWIPLRQISRWASATRQNHWITVVGRLRPGVNLRTAQQDMTRIASELEREYGSNRARGVFVEPVEEVLRGQVRQPLVVLFGAVLAVLLIVCANAGNLFLARGLERTRELAVLRAMGAGSRQLARKFLAESLIITGTAAAVGIGLSFLATRGLMALAPSEIAALSEVRVDWRLLLFALAVTAGTTLVFGLVPLFQARDTDLQRALKEGRSQSPGAGRMRLRQVLVVAQTALALVLLAGAGLMINSLWRLQRVDPGFAASRTLRMDYRLPDSRYPRDFSKWPRWTEVHDFNSRLLQRVEALSGVRSAALTSNHPLDPGFTNSFVIVGRESEAREQGELKTRLVSHRYFETAGLDLVAGRVLTDRDTTDSPAVLLLNRAAVERYFKGHPALGEKIRMWGLEREIAGIVGNERMHGPARETPPAMYLPLTQAPSFGSVTLMVRTEADPRHLIGPVREAVWEADPSLALYNIATMEETLGMSVARERFTSALLAFFAAVAIFLAAVGLHGVLSYTVAQRTREIGVRLALGASRGLVLEMVVRRGMSLALLGLVLGLAGALALSRLLEGLLYGVSATDPLTYLLVAGGLLVVSVLACTLPALRATAIDPAAALREE